MPRKSAKIESERVKINLPQNSNSKQSKKYANQVSKAIKKVNLFVCFILLIISAALGAGAFFVVSRNDCFELIGEQEITIEMVISEDETTIFGSFTDEHKVKIIEFGKDISAQVKIETDMEKESDGSYTVSEEGTYYIKYSVDSIKYGKIFTIEKIRLIHFIEPIVREEIVPDAISLCLGEGV